MKVEPWPGSVTTVDVATHHPAELRLRARSSPVPPHLRVVDTSAWENASQRCAVCASVIPIPVSVTREGERASDAGLRAWAGDGERDRAIRRELGRVRQQVEQHLLRLHKIGAHRTDVGRDGARNSDLCLDATSSSSVLACSSEKRRAFSTAITA